MINFNGNLQKLSAILSCENRGYKFGDALFETLKIVNNKILFWEDHYFRLMSSMRILRMEIPMTFTMEFLEQEILRAIEANGLKNASVRVRLNVDRGEGGKYSPITNIINYSVIVEKIDSDLYKIDRDKKCIVDLFKDYFIAPGLLSNLKTNNRVVNVLGSIYASENNLNNCLLLNTNKNVIETLQGNLFLVKDNVIKTPSLEDGCINGIMRKQIIEIIKSFSDYCIEEASISPFELQKADELFSTNIIVGIQSITKYRKKEFATKVSEIVIKELNIKLKLAQL